MRDAYCDGSCDKVADDDSSCSLKLAGELFLLAQSVTDIIYMSPSSLPVIRPAKPIRAYYSGKAISSAVPFGTYF